MISDSSGFQLWAHALHNSQCQEDDPFELGYWAQTLFQAWSASSTAQTLCDHEAGMRRGPDNMLQTAFQEQLGARHIIQ